MLLAKGWEEIYSNFDFTDSIIEKITWENELLDLVLTIDYYNSDQELILKVRFRDCLKADFSLTANMLRVPPEDRYSYSMSWHTIQHYRLLEESELLSLYEQKELYHVQIFTAEYEIPWLSVVSKEIRIESIE